MPLTKPALVNEEPGRPITAQGWNAIVDAFWTWVNTSLSRTGPE